MSASRIARYSGLRIVMLALIALLVIKIGRHVRHARKHSAETTVEAVKPGDTAVFPENMLIVVKNPDKVEHGVHAYSYGEQCLALAGSPMTVIAVHEDRVLVRHEKPVEWFYGVCIPGVLTFFDTADFRKFNERYAENAAKADTERELVKKLLQPEAPQDAAPEDVQ